MNYMDYVKSIFGYQPAPYMEKDGFNLGPVINTISNKVGQWYDKNFNPYYPVFTREDNNTYVIDKDDNVIPIRDYMMNYNWR